jgi:hypothetical protein
MLDKHSEVQDMADEKPELNPSDESKKDTVRINLPPGLAGKAAAPATGMAPTVKLRPSPAPAAAPEEEAKKETAVMGMPVAVPQPKKDTSRVAVPAAKPAGPVAAKPAVPEVPRPTVKLKREEAPVAPPPPAAKPVEPVPAPQPAGAQTSIVDLILAVAAFVCAGAVSYYLWTVLQIPQ